MTKTNMFTCALLAHLHGVTGTGVSGTAAEEDKDLLYHNIMKKEYNFSCENVEWTEDDHEDGSDSDKKTNWFRGLFGYNKKGHWKIPFVRNNVQPEDIKLGKRSIHSNVHWYRLSQLREHEVLRKDIVKHAGFPVRRTIFSRKKEDKKQVQDSCEKLNNWLTVIRTVDRIFDTSKDFTMTSEMVRSIKSFHKKHARELKSVQRLSTQGFKKQKGIWGIFKSKITKVARKLEEKIFNFTRAKPGSIEEKNAEQFQKATNLVIAAGDKHQQKKVYKLLIKV